MIDTLCFSGGGINGISFLGSLKYLHECGYLDEEKITKYVGTSIGSLFALLLVIGFKNEDLIDFVLKFDFTKFELDSKCDNLFNSNGLDDGEKIMIFLKTLFYDKMGVEDLTFLELFNRTGKTLSVLVTNYTKSTNEVFSHENTPDTSVMLAIRISISVPLIFTPVKYNDCYYIDGGITCNFGLFCCDNKSTLGFAIDFSDDENEFGNLFNFMRNICKIVITSNSMNFLNYLEEKQQFNILKIKCRQKEAFEFTVSKEKITYLIEDGIISSKKYYNNFVINDIMDNLIKNIELIYK